MFGLFKKKADPVERLSELSVHMFMLESSNVENRRQIEALVKKVDEAQRVEIRMAKTIADQAEQIRAITEQVAEHVGDIARIDDFNEAIAEEFSDCSTQTTIHYRQIAGLWKGLEKNGAAIESLKGRT